MEEGSKLSPPSERGQLVSGASECYYAAGTSFLGLPISCRMRVEHPELPSFVRLSRGLKSRPYAESHEEQFSESS